MPIVILKSGPPIDVEGFSPSASRSKRGSIRLAPGIPTSVTSDELAVISRKGLPVEILADAVQKVTTAITTAVTSEATPKSDKTAKVPTVKKSTAKE